MKGKYLIVKKEGFIVITATLKDAKRALKRKHPGWRYDPYNLERYGNVVVLFPSASAKENLPNVEGIYEISEAENILKKIYRNRKTIKEYLKMINENAEVIEKRKPVPKGEPDPIKLLDLYYGGEKILKYIIDNNSIRYFTYGDYKIAEFKNYYGIYDEFKQLYLSIYKKSSAEEIAEFVEKSDMMLDSDEYKGARELFTSEHFRILKGIRLSDVIRKFADSFIGYVRCSDLEEEWWSDDKDINLCNAVKQRLTEIKVYLNIKPFLESKLNELEDIRDVVPPTSIGF